MIGYKTSGKYISKFIPFKFESNKIQFIPINPNIVSGSTIKYYYKLNIGDTWTEILPNIDEIIPNSNGLYYQIELTGNGLTTPSLDDLKIRYYQV